MNAAEANVGARRGWAAGLALASLVLPVTTIFIRGQATNPGNLSDYRLTVVALILGIAAAAGAFVFNRALAPAWFRWLTVGLAGLGALVAAYLLLALIGTCGLSVLGGACNS